MKNAAPRSGRERTVVGVPSVAERQETKAMPPEMAPGSRDRPGEGDTRHIVGVVITYTWRPQGQLFPIYEGKNFIGRADVSDEALPRPCDIQIPEDTQMSAEHALILYRQGNCEIIDQETTNGTWVNGKSLRSNQGEELPDHATIRTGETEWTFIRIEPSAKPGEEEAPRAFPKPLEKNTPKDQTPVR